MNWDKVDQKKFGQNLRAARKNFGITQEQLKVHIGSDSQGYISDIESGVKKPSYVMASHIAFILGIPLECLTEGKSIPKTAIEAWQKDKRKPSSTWLQSVRNSFQKIRAEESKKGDHQISSLKEEIASYQRQESTSQEVPIISWTTAGEAHEYSGIPFSWQETITVDIPKRVKALGIQIVGDSMEPRHYEGQIAIVLPESRAVNGDLVIANIRGTGTVFKKFHCNGDPKNLIITLTSYNPVYPPIKLREKDFFWIWPVAEVVSRYRKF